LKKLDRGFYEGVKMSTTFTLQVPRTSKEAREFFKSAIGVEMKSFSAEGYPIIGLPNVWFEAGGIPGKKIQTRICRLNGTLNASAMTVFYQVLQYIEKAPDHRLHIVSSNRSVRIIRKPDDTCEVREWTP
jgi:hypothetical protein